MCEVSYHYGVKVKLFCKFIVIELQKVPGAAEEVSAIGEVLRDIAGLLPDIVSQIQLYSVLQNADRFLTGTEEEAYIPQLLDGDNPHVARDLKLFCLNTPK